MKYKDLNTHHEDYCKTEILKLQLLYQGGSKLLDNSNLFIYKEINETDTAYQFRLKSSAYRNYLSEITNSYISEVFAKTISVLPDNTSSDSSTPGTDLLNKNYDSFYEEFAENCDYKGTTLVNKLKYVLQEAMIIGRAYLQIDFNKQTVQPLNIVEEKELGLSRPYINHIPVECVVDWHLNELTNKFDWLLIKSNYKNKQNFFSKSKEVIQFKLWIKESGKISYVVFEFDKPQDKEEPEAETEARVVDKGTTSFKEIPIVVLTTPSELNLGNLIGSLCVEHFRQYSALIFAQKRNLFSIPVYQLGPEVSSSGDYSEISQDPNRGEQSIRHMRQKGFAVTGPEDKIYFAEPSGNVYTVITEQLNDLQKEIHRVSAVQANAIKSGSLSDSGISKAIDNRAKEIVLTAYGELIKQFTTKIYNIISEERSDNIKWVVLGMDNFRLSVNRQQLLSEATSLQLINIPSKTFQKALYLQIAEQMLDTLSPQEQIVIKEEISDAIDRNEHLIDDEDEDSEEESKDE